MMPQFGTHFRESVYGAAPPRIGRLLPKTGRLQAEKRKASYEKAEGEKAEGFFDGYTYTVHTYVRVVADYMYSAVPWLFSPSTSNSG